MNTAAVVTVTQLNAYIKNKMDSDLFLNLVFVKGEISNFKAHSSGHCYFTLKDDSSLLKAVMFKTSAQRVKFRIENGQKVIALGKISLYERDGVYQLYVSDIEPDGIGALNLAYEQLKEKLQNEGLFDQKYKKPLPKYPEKIGIVTSPTGAAVKDMLNIIKRRFNYLEVTIYPAIVQGEQASISISKGIEFFNEKYPVDTIIIGRGGGSIEDLWAFNEEILARTIFKSQIPIVSAVGHETDYTISDFVSDLRAPTPSAAAELVTVDALQLGVFLDQAKARCTTAFHKFLLSKKERIDSILSRPVLKNPYQLIENKAEYLDRLSEGVFKDYQTIFQKKTDSFKGLCAMLDALSPLKVLTRGYSYVEDDNEQIITKASDVKINSHLNVILKDGKVACKVEAIKLTKKG